LVLAWKPSARTPARRAIRSAVPESHDHARRRQVRLASLRNLDQLPPTGALVIAAPLKIVNGSGSPLRVLAIV
jgi:kynurenine formamidase